MFGKREKDLFKPDSLRDSAESLADNLVSRSHESSEAILILWDIIENHSHEVDLKGTIDHIHEGFSHTQFDDVVKYPYLDDIRLEFSTWRFQCIEEAFFSYYFCRLPLLICLNHVRHKGKSRVPSEHEIDTIAKTCLVRWSVAHRDSAYEVPKEFQKIWALTSRWAKPNDRVAALYARDWLWEALNKSYPQMLAGGNATNTLIQAVEYCFNMFYNSLEELYTRWMVYYANWGAFVGDETIDEFLERLKNQR